MSCPDASELLELSQGLLGPEQAAALERHIDECSDCHELLAQWIKLADDEPRSADDLRAELLERGTPVGRYLILEPVGAGSMGTVFSAYDPKLDRRVALKLMRLTGTAAAAEREARLEREARALARLSHPNVVAVHDVGTVAGQLFIAMELLEGRTLTAWMSQGLHPWREVVEVFVQAGQGLAAAHAAGLVHRDFKPDNVLIGKGGQVKVGDFGLARAEEASESRPGAPVVPAALDLAAASTKTAAGAVVGTPAYMAPESLRGEVADARADQYSFCATLFEVLCGHRLSPSEVRAGWPKQDERCAPGWIRRIVQRGLNADPALRFDSMPALLEALQDDPVVLRRRVLLGVGAALVLALVAAGAFRFAARDQASCQQAGQALEQAWGPEAKQAAHRAFLATGRPYAEAAWSSASLMMDAHAASWTRQRTEACEAVKVRREQSEEVLALRAACLDRQRYELEALARLWSEADAVIVEKASQAAASLGDLRRCADVDALRRSAPDSEEARRQSDDIRKNIAQATARFNSGKFVEGLAIAQAASELASKLQLKAVEAEALVPLALLYERTGRFDQLEPTLQRALQAAEAGRNPEAAATAAAYLVSTLGVRGTRFAEAHLMADHGRAFIAARGGDPLLEALVLNNEAMVFWQQGELAQAFATLDRAVELREKNLGPGHMLTAQSTINLCLLLENAGRYGEAEQACRKGLKIFEKVYGAEHPATAMGIHNLATVLLSEGKLAEALELQRKAQAMVEATSAAESALAAEALEQLGTLLALSGRSAEAVSVLERSLAMRRKLFGADHPQTAASLARLGQAQTRRGDLPAALASLARAATVFEKTLGPDHQNLGETLALSGDALLAQGHGDEALAAYRRALAILEKALGKDHAKLAEAVLGLGLAQLAIGQPGLAADTLERALALAQKTPDDAVKIARARFALARALDRSGKDRARAQELARQARTPLVGEPEEKELDAWLAGHR